MDINFSWESLPNGVEILEWVMRKIQLGAALIVVILFGVGVTDLAIAIIESYRSGVLTNVDEVIQFIEFVLLLFILVEAYRTIVAYTQSKDARYILALVIYAGIIAVIRKIIILRPGEFEQSIDAMFVAAGYSVLLISLAVILYILSNHSLEVNYNETEEEMEEKEGEEEVESEEENEDGQGKD